MRNKAILLLCLAALMIFMSACSPNGDGSTTTDSTLGNDEASETDMTETTAEETTAAKEQVVLTPVTLDDIPAFSGGAKRSDYNCGDGVYMKIVNMAFEQEYRAYLEKLPTLGYTEVSAREVEGNCFYTFSREGTALIASYFKAESIVRLTILPYDPYEAYSDIYGVTNAASGDVEPLVTMVNSGNNGEDTGMSYVIRTTEGSFIIIDGGWTGIGEGKKLMNLLKEQNTGDSLPVIAAWILTHPHSDHIGAIADVAAAYYDEVVLERVIFNYMDDEMLAKSDSDKILSNNASPLNILRRTLKAEKKWGYTQVIKPHTGDVLNIDGVTVDILHTHEDVAPDTDALLYNNAASMVFKVTAGGHSALFLADLTSKNMLAIATRFGNHLKCDILQPTHHGRTHGRIEVYKLVSPTVVLWDCALSSYNEYKNQDYNQYLINNFPRHYISENGTVTLSMKTLAEVP